MYVSTPSSPLLFLLCLRNLHLFHRLLCLFHLPPSAPRPSPTLASSGSLCTSPSCSCIAFSPTLPLRHPPLARPLARSAACSLSLSLPPASAYTSAFGLPRSFRPRISRAWRFTLNAVRFPPPFRGNTRECWRFGGGSRGDGGRVRRGFSLSRARALARPADRPSLHRGENRPKIRGRGAHRGPDTLFLRPLISVRRSRESAWYGALAEKESFPSGGRARAFPDRVAESISGARR